MAQDDFKLSVCSQACPKRVYFASTVANAVLWFCSYMFDEHVPVQIFMHVPCPDVSVVVLALDYQIHPQKPAHSTDTHRLSAHVCPLNYQIHPQKKKNGAQHGHTSSCPDVFVF
jgi:hypothetical protein